MKWLRKDGELSESRTTKDMFDRRLRFTNISESDGGEYLCIAENTQGKVTHTYTLTVEGVSHSLKHTHTHTHTLTNAQTLKQNFTERMRQRNFADAA